jgi:hypothetical protein
MTVIRRSPDIGLKIRLQPLASEGVAVPAPTPAPMPGGCEVDGVVWLAQPQYQAETYGGSVYGWWELPSLGNYAAVGVDETGALIYPDDVAQGPDFVQVWVPWYYDDDGPGNPVPPITVVGAALGRMTCGVVWSVERAGSVTMPCNVDVSGALAWCVISPLPGSQVENYLGYEDITLTARCGDLIVGTLRLQVILDGW